MIRLNMAIPPSAGTEQARPAWLDRLTGSPNGRRLGDDVVDIEFAARLAGGHAVHAGIQCVAQQHPQRRAVDQNDKSFLPDLPVRSAHPVPGITNP